jgi:hypothetical protein
MYYAQQALIQHLKLGGIAAKTIKGYAAELANIREEALDLSVALPAVLVYYGGPGATDNADAPGYVFHLFVLTETHTLDAETGMTANLSLVTQIADWLRQRDHAVIPTVGANGSYVIDRAGVIVEPLVCRPKWTAHYIVVPLMDKRIR